MRSSSERRTSLLCPYTRVWNLHLWTWVPMPVVAQPRVSVSGGS